MTPAQAEALANTDRRPGSIEGVPADPGADERRTYRGRDLGEILPQIRAELGPDAVVTCQREGLVGGIGGFFAQRFIEVEAIAAPAAASVDFYDGEDAEPTTADFEAVSVEERESHAPSFSETLDGVVAEAIVDRGLGEVPDVQATRKHAEPSPVVGAPGSAATALGGAVHAPSPAAIVMHSIAANTGGIESVGFAGEAREVGELLTARGLGTRLAANLISDARTHDLPFAGGGGIRAALRASLTRRLPRHRGLPADGALVALVGGGGSGKTRCAASIAAAYRSASALGVRAVVLGRYDSGAELSALLEPHGVAVHTAERGSRAAGEIAISRAGELVVADTPTVSPADPAGIGVLGVELAALRPDEVLVTLAATANAASARQMLAALAPLAPTGIIVTHADETDQLGVAVELSLDTGLPLVYIHAGLELPGALAPADPTSIAERLLA
jgi:flagellar biosynthesis GTPase FlhF